MNLLKWTDRQSKGIILTVAPLRSQSKSRPFYSRPSLDSKTKVPIKLIVTEIPWSSPPSLIKFVHLSCSWPAPATVHADKCPNHDFAESPVFIQPAHAPISPHQRGPCEKKTHFFDRVDLQKGPKPIENAPNYPPPPFAVCCMLQKKVFNLISGLLPGFVIDDPADHAETYGVLIYECPLQRELLAESKPGRRAPTLGVRARLIKFIFLSARGTLQKLLSFFFRESFRDKTPNHGPGVASYAS